MPSQFDRSAVEAVAVTEIAPLTYVNDHKPDILRNGKGFGGWTLAMGINAAAVSVKIDEYQLYSAVGHFLAAVEPSEKLTSKVRVVRDTRVFATRYVEIWQPVKGKERPVMTMTVDFQRPEKDALLDFSPPPKYDYTPAEGSFSIEKMKSLGRERGFPEKAVDAALGRPFRFKTGKFECRSAPEGMWGRSLYGLLPPSEWMWKDKRAPWDKTTVEYFRSWKPLQGHFENALAIAWLQDGGTSYIPPRLEGVSFDRIAAVGSLDFALRIFTADLDVNEFNAREEYPVSAGEGRTYVEARMWDKNGRLISSMTQQCILRPKKDSKI